MKIKITAFLTLLFILTSCGGSKKTAKKASPAQSPVIIEIPAPIPESPKPEPILEEPVIEAPIKEVTEKLIPVMETPPDPNQYFVIIGSFRNYDNALKFQQIIKNDGFNSVLLRNDKGLYRVSVLGTNDIMAARKEIGGIRSRFPKYKDTWLLIQGK